MTMIDIPCELCKHYNNGIRLTSNISWFKKLWNKYDKLTYQLIIILAALIGISVGL